MKKQFNLAVISIFISINCYSQHPLETGAEYMRFFGKGYNHTKVAVRGETFNSKNSYSAGITYQLSSSKSYSVSKGFGLYFGYRYSFKSTVIWKQSICRSKNFIFVRKF